MELHDQVLITSENRMGDADDLSEVHPKIGFLLSSEFRKKLAASMVFPIRRQVNYKGLTRTYTLDNLPSKCGVKVVL